MSPTVALAHGAFADASSYAALVPEPLADGLAARRTEPPGGMVSSSDTTIDPDVERFGYRRAGMTTVEIDSSHLVAHPQEVADLVRTATKALEW